MSEYTIQTSDSPVITETSLLDRIPRWLLAFLAGVAPAVVTVALIGGYLKRNLFDFRPASWNDQVYYWHQILTFSRAGFNGGYYMVNERLPVLDFFHFGASGFFYPALYGTLGRVIGWETYTGILLNMIGIAIAVWIVIYVAKLDRIQIVLMGLLLVAVAPVLLFMPTISQESFHQIAALILAAIFYRLLRRDLSLPRWLIPVGLVFLVIISLLRFSWILMFLPFFILSQKKWTWPRLTGALIVSGILAVIILVIFQVTSAPGNNSVFSRGEMLSSAPLAGIKVMWDIALNNLGNMLRVNNIHQMNFETSEFVQFFVLLFGLILGGQIFLNREAQPRISLMRSQEWLFQVYNLIAIFGASLIFYLSSGYHRVLAPHILLAGVLLIAFRHFRLVIIVVVIGLFGIGTFLAAYSQWGVNFNRFSPGKLQQLEAPYQQFLIYDAKADPWCNTVLVQLLFLDNRATFVPAGIGISLFFAASDQPLPIHSQYLMLDPLSYEVLHTRTNLAFLANIPGGKLYRNLDADCAAS